jgi:hypothetical protein
MWQTASLQTRKVPDTILRARNVTNVPLTVIRIPASYERGTPLDMVLVGGDGTGALHQLDLCPVLISEGTMALPRNLTLAH